MIAKLEIEWVQLVNIFTEAEASLAASYVRFWE